MAHQDVNHIIHFSNYATVMSLNDTVDGSEIPNNHLGWPINNGINYQPQLVSRISSINRM